MSLNHFLNDTLIDAKFNSVDTVTLSINGVPFNPSSITAGEYNANMVVTNATNGAAVASTQYVSVNGVTTVFGEYKCDVQAFNNISLAFDLPAGTTSQLSKRTAVLSSNKAGGLMFSLSADAQTSNTRMVLTAYTNGGTVATAANQIGTYFFYSFTFTNS
jgi:hypothetical protein